ncbi:hypothetical protein PFICI_11146 [Pestalotiopsis fici W106-1]|uniref:NAD-dependent epimerase/dehydratase domain-containing protein n=1 Tax=Pestalotiopsis fici (strain W106-1 / CGMCC3.15140) TaxID=1229662 RepID=W3WVZ2_PESFW|nr:uncharacterized protein PFICI_11146 [Pestalotiopsis fici W106-1]ETS77272.1 hypothetical protein PFICI_11146 [Pestalotiopsis fici W106-1]
MPVVQPGGLVLITGASGFIAAHTIGVFLDEGFRVRGTVRSQAKGEYLKNLFKKKAGSFDYCIVEDISEVSSQVESTGIGKRGKQEQ